MNRSVCKFCEQNPRMVTNGNHGQMFCKSCSGVSTAYGRYIKRLNGTERISHRDFYMEWTLKKEITEQCPFCLEDWHPYEYGMTRKGSCRSCREIYYSWNSLRKRRGVDIDPHDYYLYSISEDSTPPHGMMGPHPKCPFCRKAPRELNKHSLTFVTACADCYILIGSYTKYVKTNPDVSRHEYYLHRLNRCQSEGTTLAELSEERRQYILRRKKGQPHPPRVRSNDVELIPLEEVYSNAPSSWGLAQFVSTLPNAGKGARHYLESR